MEATDSKIKQQIEFYFSDSNLRRDAFLKSTIEADPERFVNISILLTFNRLKSLTDDPEKVASSIHDSNMVELSTCGSKIRRIHELNPIDTSKERTLYAKGYPTDDSDLTIDQITEIFSNFGNVMMVRLRKDKISSKFNGSCFVEFKTEEEMKSAVAAAHDEDGKIKMKYKDSTLLCVLPLAEWLFRKQHKSNRKGKSANITEVPGSKRTRDEISEKEIKIEFTPGLILKISNIPKDSTVFQIKEFFKSICEVKYVEYSPGESDGFIRFPTLEAVDTAKKVLEKGISLVSGAENLTGECLSGDDELSYWKKIEESTKLKNSKKGSRGGKNNWKGRGGKKARKN